MDYKNVTVELERGLSDENGVQHKQLILREMIVKDLLDNGGGNEDSRNVQILAKRVIRIGAIENPGLLLIEKLSMADYARIVEAANDMDQ